jgi:hypothetical protein
MDTVDAASAIDHCARMLTAFHPSLLSLHACVHTRADVLHTSDSVSVVPSMSVSLHW